MDFKSLLIIGAIFIAGLVFGQVLRYMKGKGRFGR
jgi:hypothetical protein